MHAPAALRGWPPPSSPLPCRLLISLQRLLHELTWGFSARPLAAVKQPVPQGQKGYTGEELKQVVAEGTGGQDVESTAGVLSAAWVASSPCLAWQEARLEVRQAAMLPAGSV